MIKTRSKSTKKNKKTRQSSPQNLQSQKLHSHKVDSRNLKKMSTIIQSKDKNGQKKLTSYFALSIPQESEETLVAADPQQQKKDQLKLQLQQKQHKLEKAKLQKQIIQSKYSKLYQQTKSYKMKAKDIIITTLRQKSAMIRRERGKIDQKLGYYATKREYVKGSFYVDIYDSLLEKQRELKAKESQLQKAKNETKKKQVRFSIKHIRKVIDQLEKKLANKQSQLNQYKERLKLHMNQEKCTYCNQNWPIVKDSHGIQRYLTLQLLGKGGFGQVYKCFDLEDNQYVAIKKMAIPQHNDDIQQQFVKHVRRQVKTQKQLKHHNIAQIKQIISETGFNFQFVIQYCSGRDLGVQLRQQKCFDEYQAKNIVFQIFDALAYMINQKPRVIHYDLKPSNIVYNYGKIKILDFGLCKHMDNEHSRMLLTSQGVGTYWYLPPQAFSENDPQITAKLDVWSAGVIFFQLLYGIRPFANDSSQKQIYSLNLISALGKKVIFPERTPKKSKVSEQAKNFIKQCLKYDPKQRISAQQAFQHSYFKS